MSAMNILMIVMLLVTVLAAGDMVVFFWRRRKMRRNEVSISRHLKQAVEGMEPVRVPESEVFIDSH